MSNIPSLTLNTNASMPLLGLGVYKATAPGEVEGAIATALDLGYRLIDTASAYKNEEGVGRGIRSSSVPRKELFITTKLWNTAQRIGDIDGAFQRSLDRLGLDYVDLYLIHWPVPGCFINSWQALERIRESGQAKAIGVSNFEISHLTGMEKSMKNQYQNATNIAARIKLHSLYSINKEGWFPWIYSQCHLQSGMNVLELGCGDGALWKQNISLLPQNIHLTLSDISDGMLRDARRALGARDSRFSFAAFDCEKIPASSESYDLVIANHVLFYCDNLENVCKEVRRVLKPGGRFLCSTYGNSHMKEISQLVSRFDARIVLSANKLYEKFGRKNGAQVLEPWFSRVEWISYEDGLLVSDPEPLISYILSCHGNQNQYLLDHYKEFRSFVKKKTEKGLHITKDAGIFICNY